MFVDTDSLGTAVASAVAEYFALQQGIDFAGVVLVAPFTDVATLVLRYAIKGIVPILSPLRGYPPLQQWFTNQVLDTWETKQRLARLVQSSQIVNLVMIHAKNDVEIPWSNTEALFYAVVNATSATGMSLAEIEGVTEHVDLMPAGWRDTWKTVGISGGLKRIAKIISPYGGQLQNAICCKLVANAPA